MNFFKKLFGAKDEVSNPKPKTPAKDSETPQKTFTQEDENSILKHCLQELLSEKTIPCEIVSDELLIPSLKMSIRGWANNKTEHPNAIVIQLNFAIKQELFDTEIFECLAGIGETINDAIKNGVASFFSGVLTSIIDSFDERHNPEIDFETNLDGYLHIWHPKVGPLQAQGKFDTDTADENKIFTLLKEDIKARVSNLRFYWIKIYVSKQVDGNIITQCTINNEHFPEAEKKMKEYAESWNTNNQFKGEKQYIIIRQCDKTWTPSKYSKEQIEALVNSAVELMESCSNQSEYEALFKNIYGITKDIQLAFELHCFIPEIYCQITLPEIKFADEITLIRPDDTRKNIKLFEISTYKYIEMAVRERIKSKYDKDKFQTVLFLSSNFKAINDAILKGGKLENLVTIPMLVNVPENYNPYR